MASIKKLGAVNFQSSWVLPHFKERIAELRNLIDEINQLKGESLLIEGKAVGKDQETLIYNAITQSRNE